ncbi:hypothetical protein IJE86_09585 [bacterium]|nr:hypothetical protein [bacterium]
MNNSPILTKPIFNKSEKNHINREYWKYRTSPIIEGYFPQYKTYEELAISRVNRTLCVILSVFVLFTLISYYFVTANEMTLNKLRKETIVLNDENSELQNKLDNLKSYYNVDKTMKSKNLLHKAKDVIEVQETKSVPTNIAVDLVNEKQSFKWSLGY